MIHMDKLKDPKLISGLVGLLLGAASMLFGAEYVPALADDCECPAEEGEGETGE